METKSSVRLNKFIAESGICSRREADRFIEKGFVSINGRKAKLADQVFPGDKVVVNGHHLEPREAEDNIYLAFNKPVGVTTTTEEHAADNIINYVNHSARIFPIGRLDKDSQGLIFLTNDGDIVNKILRAENAHEKEYLVTVDKPITDKFIDGMIHGVPILGVVTRKCKVVKETPFIFRIVLIQGLNRQIRRMCEHFGYQVMKLERVRIMNVSLKGLSLGEWRDLTQDELQGIFKLIKNSSSEKLNAAKPAKSTNPISSNPPKTQNSRPPKRNSAPVSANLEEIKAGIVPKRKGKEMVGKGVQDVSQLPKTLKINYLINYSPFFAIE
ncbi:MAG: 23S rRNA pseudouridine(2604) synthase RluF [Bacteroidetes bacterium]|nr:23S rRNA pseudouridine(2604) synthase RluF [Bacteroidota bacterium]